MSIINRDTIIYVIASRRTLRTREIDRALKLLMGLSLYLEELVSLIKRRCAHLAIRVSRFDTQLIWTELFKHVFLLFSSRFSFYCLLALDLLALHRGKIQEKNPVPIFLTCYFDVASLCPDKE